MRSNPSTAPDPQTAARVYVEALRQLFPQLSYSLKKSLQFHLDLYRNQSDKQEWMREARHSFEAKIRAAYPLVETHNWPAWPIVEMVPLAADGAVESNRFAGLEDQIRRVSGKLPSADSPAIETAAAPIDDVDEPSAPPTAPSSFAESAIESGATSPRNDETEAVAPRPVHETFWEQWDNLGTLKVETEPEIETAPEVETAPEIEAVPEIEIEPEIETVAEIETETESGFIWPRAAVVGELLARIEDERALLNEAAHRMAALLHGGMELAEAEQCRADWRASRAALDELWQQLEALAAPLTAGATVAIPRDAALDEELGRMVALLQMHPAARELGSATYDLKLRGLLADLKERARHTVRQANLEAWVDDWNAGYIEDPVGLRDNLKALREQLEVLCARPLEDELEAIAGEFRRTPNAESADDGGDNARSESSDERRCELFFQRMGWNGKPGRTLSSLSQQRGISREWVRKIVAALEHWVSQRRFFTPALERALRIIGENLPAREDELARLLRDSGATREVWSLEALAETARSLQREPEFLCAPLPDAEVSSAAVLVWEAERFAGEIANKECPQHLWQKIYRHVWERGIGYWPALQDEIGDDAALSVAQLLLRSHPAVRWLDEERNWFWLQTARVMHNTENRLFVPLERALSVAGRLSLARLYAAATRFHFHSQRAGRQWEMPPQPIFERWCVAQDRLILDNGDITMPDVPHWSEFLDNTEATLIEILAEQGPLSRWKFYQLAAEKGVAKPTFYRYVDELSTIEELDEGIFALVGAEVSSAQIQAIREDFSNFRRRFYLRYGRLDDGRLWMSHRLSRGAINSGSLNLPAPMRGLIEGRYQLITPQGALVGTLAFNFNQCWGLSNYLANQAAPRDRVTLILDPSSRHALIHLGLEELPIAIRSQVEGLDDTDSDDEEEDEL